MLHWRDIENSSIKKYKSIIIYIAYLCICLTSLLSENKIKVDNEIVNSLKGEDSSGNTQAETSIKEETQRRNKENTTFDVNDATNNAPILEFLNNPYYEVNLPEPIEIPIEDEYVLPAPSVIPIEDEYVLPAPSVIQIEDEHV